MANSGVDNPDFPIFDICWFRNMWPFVVGFVTANINFDNMMNYIINTSTSEI